MSRRPPQTIDAGRLRRRFADTRAFQMLRAHYVVRWRLTGSGLIDAIKRERRNYNEPLRQPIARLARQLRALQRQHDNQEHTS